MSQIYSGLVPDLSQVAIIEFANEHKRIGNAYISFPILDSPTGFVRMTGDDLVRVRREMTPAQQRNLEEKLDFAVNSPHYRCHKYQPRKQVIHHDRT